MKRLGGIVLPLLALLLHGCAVPQSLPQAGSLDGGAADVVVIGKIELVPPLEQGEQKSHWNVIGEQRMFRIWMATGPEFRPVDTRQLRPAEFQAAIEADWGRPFMLRMPRQRTYLNGGATFLDGLERSRLWFPGGLYFDVPADARAVYIGTLRYHRNDFNTITRVEVLDERSDVARVLPAGSPAQVRASLLRRVR